METDKTSCRACSTGLGTHFVGANLQVGPGAELKLRPYVHEEERLFVGPGLQTPTGPMFTIIRRPGFPARLRREPGSCASLKAGLRESVGLDQ